MLVSWESRAKRELWRQILVWSDKFWRQRNWHLLLGNRDRLEWWCIWYMYESINRQEPGSTPSCSINVKSFGCLTRMTPSMAEMSWMSKSLKTIHESVESLVSDTWFSMQTLIFFVECHYTECSLQNWKLCFEDDCPHSRLSDCSTASLKGAVACQYEFIVNVRKSVGGQNCIGKAKHFRATWCQSTDRDDKKQKRARQ